MTLRRAPARLPPPKPNYSFTQRPKTRTALFWWKRRLWIESTFALTVYEPWEKVVVLTIFAILCLAMSIVLFKYLPGQFVVMRRRMIYYIWGGDLDASDRVLWKYLGLAKESRGVGSGSGRMELG
ncbi:hypothetical protein GALMADRAFT_271655 [Galerina marginata CBS 339.88]|uniref:Uncharacterized protein n=1 Tax=Galerina marginata (strain CBS 339.88) TaxID=685588 RepID=A0A067SRA7_GALM3|nr:hypothetical protein GALMADRAFT_271655 [Galerina marginata CBS 339.88]